MTTVRWLLAAMLALGACGCGLSEGDSCEPGRGVCPFVAHGDGLVCVGGRIAHARCLGEGACVADGDKVRCDQSLGEVGDVCLGGNACSVDRRSFLVCRSHRFVLGARCPSGCVLEGDRARCDTPELAPPLQ